MPSQSINTLSALSHHIHFTVSLPFFAMTDAHVFFISDPSAEQLQAIVGLYRQAGWWPEQGEDDYALLARLVRQSYCFAVAMAGENMIGMGRAISDGVSDAYVQDVTVAAAWQRSGVGTRLVRHILDRLQAEGIAWVGLIAERGSAPFYRQFGFDEMVNAQPMLLSRCN
jgi:spermidine synthase